MLKLLILILVLINSVFNRTFKGLNRKYYSKNDNTSSWLHNNRIIAGYVPLQQPGAAFTGIVYQSSSTETLYQISLDLKLVWEDLSYSSTDAFPEGYIIISNMILYSIKNGVPDHNIHEPGLCNPTHYMLPSSTGVGSPVNYYSGDAQVICPGELYHSIGNVINGNVCIFNNLTESCEFKYNSLNDKYWTGLNLDAGDQLRIQVSYQIFGGSSYVAKGIALAGLFNWRSTYP